MRPCIYPRICSGTTCPHFVNSSQSTENISLWFAVYSVSNLNCWSDCFLRIIRNGANEACGLTFIPVPFCRPWQNPSLWCRWWQSQLILNSSPGVWCRTALSHYQYLPQLHSDYFMKHFLGWILINFYYKTVLHVCKITFLKYVSLRSEHQKQEEWMLCYCELRV